LPSLPYPTLIGRCPVRGKTLSDETTDLNSQVIPASLRCAWQSTDDNIRSGRHSIEILETQRFQPATNQIAVNGDADGLRNDETESGRSRDNVAGCIQRCASHINDRVRGREATAAAHEAAVVVCPDEPVGSSQHEKRYEKTRLRGEFGASLATTSTQDGAAGASAHSQAESVHLGATTVVRLESSLAHDSFLVVEGSNFVKARPQESIGSQGSEGKPRGLKSTD
jgi:hypothetical protein